MGHVRFDPDRGVELVNALPCKKIKHVAEIRTVRAVDFRVMTIRARYRRKSLVLDIEDFCEHPARCAELVGVKVVAAAFQALPVLVLHGVRTFWSVVMY
jgi:hypothetical protein